MSGILTLTLKCVFLLKSMKMVELTTNGYNFFRTALHVGAQTETMYLLTLEENRMMTKKSFTAATIQQRIVTANDSF